MITALATSSCLALAATSYNVSRGAIKSALSTPAEVGGVGVMHIPEAWLPILARAGFAPEQVEGNPCTNIEAGAWILAYVQARSPHPHTQAATPSLALPAETNSSSSDDCVAKAANFYHIPVSLLSAVLRTEGGRVGQIHENENGSYDIGPAQINSIWLPVLAKSGITRGMVLNDRCLNISIGAWILGQSLNGANPQDPTEFWQHVGDYNSHTPFWNHIYAVKVWENLK